MKKILMIPNHKGDYIAVIPKLISYNQNCKKIYEIKKGGLLDLRV